MVNFTDLIKGRHFHALFNHIRLPYRKSYRITASFQASYKVMAATPVILKLSDLRIKCISFKNSYHLIMIGQKPTRDPSPSGRIMFHIRARYHVTSHRTHSPSEHDAR